MASSEPRRVLKPDPGTGKMSSDRDVSHDTRRGDVTTTSSLFSLGPILGGLSLIVSISVGAWLYQQKSVLENHIQNLNNSIGILDRRLAEEIKKNDDTRKRLNAIIASKLKGVNDRITRAEQLVNYLENSTEERLNAIHDVLPDAKPQRRTPTVRLPKPMRPQAVEEERPKPARRPAPKPTKPEPILDLDDTEDPGELDDDIDDFNNA